MPARFPWAPAAGRLLAFLYGLLHAGVSSTWGAEPIPSPQASPVTNAVLMTNLVGSRPAGAGVLTHQPSPSEDSASLKREAVEIAGQISKTYPDDALTFALLGSAYYNTGQADEAVKYLEKCIQLSPGEAEAYEVLGMIAYEKGKTEDAIRLCEDALKRGPGNPKVLNRLGHAFMDVGQVDDAIRTLKQAVELPKAISESWYLLGQAYLQAKDFGAAKESFLKAIALLPDHTQAFFGLFTACTRLGQTEEAIKYRERFQKLEASDRQVLTEQNTGEEGSGGVTQVRKVVAGTIFGAAQVYQSHGQFEKAAEFLIRAVTLDPDNLGYRAAMEAFYVQRNEVAKGIEVNRQLVAALPSNPLGHLYLGRLYFRTKQFEPAENCYLKVKELAPDWSEGYRSLAELYLRSQLKVSETPSLARAVVKLEPTAPHYYLLAVASAANNDRTTAIGALKHALELRPGEKKYQQLLDRLQSAP